MAQKSVYNTNFQFAIFNSYFGFKHTYCAVRNIVLPPSDKIYSS